MGNCHETNSSRKNKRPSKSPKISERRIPKDVDLGDEPPERPAVEPRTSVKKNVKENFEMYMFGVDSDGAGKFLVFDPLKETFSLRQPPINFEILNYMQAVLVGDTIYFTGGINRALTKAFSSVSSLNPAKNKAVPLSNMISPRYSHNSIYLEGVLYVFGGRNSAGDQGILRKCEALSIISGKNSVWREIAEMPRVRCSSFSFIYEKEIYLCGGYTGKSSNKPNMEH